MDQTVKKLIFGLNDMVTISQDNIITTTLTLIRAVEKREEMSGSQKKMAVLKVLHHLCVCYSPPNKTNSIILVEYVLLNIIPAVIDNMITVSKFGVKEKPRNKYSRIFRMLCFKINNR